MGKSRVLLFSHGQFCQSLAETVELFIGKQSDLYSVPLLPDESPESYEERVEFILRELDGKDAICMVDILGGTPSNVLLRLSRKYDFGLVSGFNLPAVIYACTEAEGRPLDEVVASIVETISESAVDLKKRFQKIRNSHQN